jgi:hypothetical protein
LGENATAIFWFRELILSQYHEALAQPSQQGDLLKSQPA